jgi:hypothetical protein
MNLPFVIDYNLDNISLRQQQYIIDGWNKINYSHDAEKIIKSRFRGNTSHIPGLSEIFELMIIDIVNKSPLDELKSRSNLNNGIGEYTNIPELEESK